MQHVARLQPGVKCYVQVFRELSWQLRNAKFAPFARETLVSVAFGTGSPTAWLRRVRRKSGRHLRNLEKRAAVLSLKQQCSEAKK